MVEVNEDGDATHSAEVARRNNMVHLGEWVSYDESHEMSGRFGNALHMGMDLGQALPPDMCEYIDAELDAGREQTIVSNLVQLLTGERRRLVAEAASRN